MKKRTHRRPVYKAQYDAWTIACASATEPLNAESLLQHENALDYAFHRLCSDEGSDSHDWNAISDAINIADTMGNNGWLDGECEADKLANDAAIKLASDTLVEAGRRLGTTKKLQLNDHEAGIIRDFIENYIAVCRRISAKNFCVAVNQTKKAIWDHLNGKRNERVTVVDMRVQLDR